MGVDEHRNKLRKYSLRIALVLLFVVCLFSAITLIAEAKTTYQPSNATMVKTGTWGSFDVNRYYAYDVNANITLDTALTTNKFTIDYVTYPNSGVFYVYLSNDGGATYKTPSNITGIKRTDGATGTQLNYVDTYSVVTEGYSTAGYYGLTDGNWKIRIAHNRTDGGKILVVSNITVYDNSGAFRVITVGDSLTEGLYSVHNGIHGYAGYLLDQQPTWSVINKGVSGRVSTDGIYYFNAEVRKYYPDAVLLLFGTNDFLQGTSADQLIANITAYQYLCDQSFITLYITTIPPRASFTDAMNVERLKYNDWVMNNWSVNNNYRYYINFNKWVTNPANTSTIVPAYTYDGTHFTDLGYQVWGTNISTSFPSTYVTPTAVPTKPNTGIDINNYSIGNWWIKYLALVFIILILGIIALVFKAFKQESEDNGISTDSLIKLVAALGFIIIVFVLVSYLLNAFVGLF